MESGMESVFIRSIRGDPEDFNKGGRALTLFSKENQQHLGTLTQSGTLIFKK